tara:strand:+ start:211 stop:474 length:264 start_codon:yes stop_codon:yes gene_type:complete
MSAYRYYFGRRNKDIGPCLGAHFTFFLLAAVNPFYQTRRVDISTFASANVVKQQLLAFIVKTNPTEPSLGARLTVQRAVRNRSARGI